MVGAAIESELRVGNPVGIPADNTAEIDPLRRVRAQIRVSENDAADPALTVWAVNRRYASATGDEAHSQTVAIAETVNQNDALQWPHPATKPSLSFAI